MGHNLLSVSDIITSLIFNLMERAADHDTASMNWQSIIIPLYYTLIE
jgi:hypothetical protein